MKFRNSDLGRRKPGGGRVLCKGNTYPSRHIRSKWSRNLPWLVNSASITCGMNRWHSGRVSDPAYCGCWFDLQWWRSRYTLLMRPNKVKIAVQCPVCHMQLFAGFSCHGNSMIISIPPFKIIYIYIYTSHQPLFHYSLLPLNETNYTFKTSLLTHQ